MQLMEAETTEFLDEFVGGKITLANHGSGRGDLVVRGTLMEVIDKSGEWMTVKYTIDEYAFGELDDADNLSWHESNGLATWTNLRTKHWVEDDGALFFGQPTPTGSTARIIAPVATATDA